MLVQPAVQSIYQNRHHKKLISKPRHHTARIVLPIEEIQEREWQMLVILFTIKCTVKSCISRDEKLRTQCTEIHLAHLKQAKRERKRGVKTAGNRLCYHF